MPRLLGVSPRDSSSVLPPSCAPCAPVLHCPEAVRAPDCICGGGCAQVVREPSREGSGGVLWVCVTLALVSVAFALGLWSGRKVPVGTCQPETRREREESSAAVRRIARPEVEWGGKSVNEEARAQLAVLRARHGNGG